MFRHNTDVILVDGFDGEQIIDAFWWKSPSSRIAATPSLQTAYLLYNWWSGDQRYQRFVQRLLNVFDGRVLELPAERHGNVAVMAFQQPQRTKSRQLKKRAEKIKRKIRPDFKRMFADLKANNQNNGRIFICKPVSGRLKTNKDTLMLKPDIIQISGPAGLLETIYLPSNTQESTRGVAVINHPNPLHRRYQHQQSHPNRRQSPQPTRLSHCYLPNLRGVGNS